MRNIAYLLILGTWIVVSTPVLASPEPLVPRLADEAARFVVGDSGHNQWTHTDEDRNVLWTLSVDYSPERGRYGGGLSFGGPTELAHVPLLRRMHELMEEMPALREVLQQGDLKVIALTSADSFDENDRAFVQMLRAQRDRRLKLREDLREYERIRARLVRLGQLGREESPLEPATLEGLEKQAQGDTYDDFIREHSRWDDELQLKGSGQ